MQHTVEEKASTQRQKHCTFTDDEYKGQILGKYTKHYSLYKRIKNKRKVMRTVLLKRVPLSVIR